MPVDHETIRVPGGARAAAGRLRLLVLGPGAFSAHALPESGDLSLGRSDTADVRIDDPSISRRHAVLHVGATLVVEDLGSANGTKVRDQKLAPNQAVEIAPGDTIELGSTMLVVQREPAPSRPWRLSTHGDFEVRLEDECARAARSGAPFAVLRVHLDAAASAGRVQEALAASARQGDLLAAYGPGEYEFLLTDCARDQAEAFARTVTARLAERGLRAGTGLATFPEDGRSPESLVARAGAAVRGLAKEEALGDAIVVADGAMQQLYRMVDRIAPSTISVLLLGETGAGKEVLASEIHRRSPRAEKPFLPLNCAALTEALLESELFGHERGSFTGAGQAKPGLLETANGGTVLLDEVGEMPTSIQAKLLRVLEDRQVLRVGALKPRSIDVRFIAATNRDLEADVARGGFRQDLYFRLNGISLVIPPLRERVAEIEKLARAFIAQAAGRDGRGTPTLAPDALELLRRYPWPGNIRELRNVMERAVLLCGDGAIGPEHLPPEKFRATYVTAPPPAFVPRPPPSPPVPASVSAEEVTRPVAVALPPPPRSLRDEIRETEERRITEALAACGGNQTRAAKMLDISRRTLVEKIKEFGIVRPRGGRSV